ncbi:hypothetical protein ACLOJK_041828 [Asimina triloba]
MEEWKHEIMMKHDEEMMNLQLELDILKSILEEERSSRGKIEERASHLSQQYGVMKNELENAKSVIEALESQQCISINEMEGLRDSNNQYEDLLKKHEQEISILKKQLAGHSEGEGRTCCSHQELRDHPSKHFDGDDSPLKIKLKRMQTSLEKARKLNVRYWSDQESQASNEEEKDEVRSQVEAEMADVIVCLQEELFALQQQVDDSNKQELLAKENMMLLETEMKELQSSLCSLSEDNKRLNNLLEEKDEEIGSLTEEWGKLACDIAEVLSGGNEALQEASIHVDSIVDSFPQRIWIGEQFGRMIRTISEKELLIEELQKCLEDAQILKSDMDWKLRSLRGATLAITEAQQQESSEKEKEIHLLRSQLSVKGLMIHELQEKVGLVESQIQRAELCAIVAFVIVNRFSELHSIHLKELKRLEIQLNESVEANLQKAALLQDQIILTSKAERQIQELEVQLKFSEENTVQLKLQIAEQQGHLCAMEKTLEKIEKDSSESKIADYVHKTKDKLNELKMGVRSINSCMDEYIKKDEWKMHTLGKHATIEVDNEETQGIVNSESESHLDTANGTERSVHVSLHDYSSKIGKNVNDMSQQEMKGFHCGQEEFKSGKIPGVHDSDVTILLKEEIECTLESLWGVQAQMNKLLAEKEAIKNSEIQSQRRIECLTAQLEAIEEMVEEANACYSVANEVLELELGEVKVFASQKVAENSCMLSKFEEAQETIKEAEETINALVRANETAKLEVERLKKMEVLWTEETDYLINEVESLQSLKDAKEQQCENLEKQFHSNLVETNNLVDVLDEILVQDCTTFLEEFKSVVSDVHYLKSELLQSVNLAKTLLEEIWSEIIAKDCAVSVLHLCHIGIFLETVTGLNAENSFLHHGLCESNSVIADLREHNFKAKRELEMCSILKGKLLFDIKNSFYRIARQENETGNFSEKLHYFEKRILDLQIQEESMLARSNSMGTELAVLMKEFDLRSKDALIALSDNEKLLKENDELHHQLRESLKLQTKVQADNEMFRESVCRELNDICSENIRMKAVTENDIDFVANMLRLIAEDMYSKDFESLVLASELKQRASKINKMETHISDLEKQSNLFAAFLEVMMTELISANVDKELEVAFLREEFHEIYVQLGTAESDKQDLLVKMKKKNDRILEMDRESKALEKDIQSLREAVNNDKSELINKSIELDSFREASERLLEELQKKETALQHLLCQMSALDLQNQKLQDDVSILQSSISRLQTELDIKTVEANDIQHSSSLAICDFELKKEKEVETLRSKLNEMDKENEKMKYEMNNLKAECSMVFEELKGKQLELDSSSSHIHSLDQENHGLKETVSTLEACITGLHSDQDMKVAEFKEVQLRLSRVVEDNEIQRATINMLKLENDSLGKDLMLIKQHKDESLSSLGLSVSRCYDLVGKVASLIEKKSNKIEERMLEEFCESRAMVVKFIAESEGLDVFAKELISANSSLQMDLAWKDEILKGLQFDLSLLQESAANAKDQKDEFEEVVARLESLEEELEAKINELDEAASHEQILEAQLFEKAKRVTALELDLEEVQKSLKLVSHDNLVMKAHIEDLLVTENSINGELAEKNKITERLEEEILELSALLRQMNHSFEDPRSDLGEVSKERDCLVSEALVLKEQLEMAQAVAEENEAIAAEAREMAEARKSYAEEKEEEVKLLEKSVEELECTVDVEMIKGEAERQSLQREELEMELQSLKHQMMTVHNSASIEMSQKQNLMKDEVDINLTRFNEEKLHDLQEAHNQIKVLQNDVAKKEAELCMQIAQCKAHISELNMHAEAQGREYKQKFRELEAMAQQVKPDTVSSNFPTNWTATKTEKHVVKPRGSGSPFKCIGLGLTQQINSEKEEELTAGRHRISELEALLATKQKEIFTLNARLAAAESMTHDVIRDLLGVKLDMAHYATLLDHQQVLKITEQAQLQNEESEEKEKVVVKLKQQLNAFIEEKQGWLDEVNRKHAEMVAARVALEKLQQHDQFLTTENQMLKEENNFLKTQNEDLAGRLRRTEALLSRVKEELASYRASRGKTPYIDMDEEQRLKNKLATTEDERVQLAQKLFSLCTSILKAAGLTMPVTDISPSVAEKVINQLKERVASLEQELQETKYKNKISGEKIRLSELRQPPSPFSTRTDENCPTPQPRRTSRASSVSALREVKKSNGGRRLFQNPPASSLELHFLPAPKPFVDPSLIEASYPHRFVRCRDELALTTRGLHRRRMLPEGGGQSLYGLNYMLFGEFQEGKGILKVRKRDGSILRVRASVAPSPQTLQHAKSVTHKSQESVRIGVLGASGYTGSEIVRLLANHPQFHITLMTADRKAGLAIGSVFPHLITQDLPNMVAIKDADFSKVDAVFCCLPHGTTQPLQYLLTEIGSHAHEIIKGLPKELKIVDLSADFRLHNINEYEEWYGHPHQAPELQKEAVYGLTEVLREEIRGARLVANPGCYPTSIQLPLVPLIKAHLIELRNIIIDAKSGVSGAGRSAKEANLYTEIAEGMHAYGITKHRHVPEIEQGLSNASGSKMTVSFTPHLIPMSRGMQSTIYVEMAPGVTIEDLYKELKTSYQVSFLCNLESQTAVFCRDQCSGASVYAHMFFGRKIVVVTISKSDFLKR